jgi:hypothetical protein
MSEISSTLALSSFFRLYRKCATAQYYGIKKTRNPETGFGPWGTTSRIV